MYIYNKKRNSLEFEDIDKILMYDKESGFLFWKINNRKARVGKIAGTVNKRGYIQIRISGIDYFAHRIAWLLTYKHWPNIVDHIDGNKTNNRINNLRNVSQRQNVLNKEKYKNGKSLPGALYQKKHNRWVSYISYGKKKVCLGYYKTQKEASDRYIEEVRKLV